MTPHLPLRLTLPWRLPFYVPMNGPHPLVESFLLGNPGVTPVDITPGGTVTRAQHDAVLLRVTQQARLIPHASTAAFLEWLSLNDQLSIESQAAHSDALFLHTTPLYAGTHPWVFHFESFPSLFMPFMSTGNTAGIDLTAQGFFALVRENLESPGCRRIFSHMRSSLDILKRVCASPAIAAKCVHVPLGIATPDESALTAKFEVEPHANEAARSTNSTNSTNCAAPLRILFTNSLHQNPHSFYLRGGHHLLEAFARLRRHLPNLELTVLSSVPGDILERFTPAHLVGVNWINRRVDDATLDNLFRSHHFFALPAAGLHSYSLLRALANGCVPIISDALGYEEYSQGIETSVLTVRGVRDMVYRAEPAGWISDEYAPFLANSESFVSQIHDLVLAHADRPTLHAMAQRNQAHCRRHHGLAASQTEFNRLLDGL